MAIKLEIQSELAKMSKDLAELSPEQLRKALKSSAIQTAFKVKDGLRQAMLEQLDRPKNFTLNALYVDKGKKGGDFEDVTIQYRDRGGKAFFPGHYLLPQVFGGSRPMKRFEKALQYTFPQLGKVYVVPSQFAKLDAFGGVPGGYITRILSNLRADLSGTQNKGSRRTRNKKLGYIIVKDGIVLNGGGRTGLADGIYEKHAGETKVYQVFHFSPSVTYQIHFKFYDVAERITRQFFPQFVSDWITKRKRPNV
jgi:hypothetical protein